MNLQVVIPVTRKTLGRTLGLPLLVLAGIGVMYLLVGWVGAVVLTVELIVLGRLLLRAARGD